METRQNRNGYIHLRYVYYSQLKNESLQEFEDDATPENIIRRPTVQEYFDGLRDSEFRQAFRMARPDKLANKLVRKIDY